MPHDLRVITYEAIVAGARRHFLRVGTIDMEELPHELAVSRATLYRRRRPPRAAASTRSSRSRTALPSRS